VLLLFCSFCPEHKWKRRKFNPSKKSVFCPNGEKKEKSPDACSGSEKTDQEKLSKQVKEAEKKLTTEKGSGEEYEDDLMAEADEAGAIGSEDEDDDVKDDDFDEDDEDEEDEDEDNYLSQEEDNSQEDEDDINATPMGIQGQILPSSSSQASSQTNSSKNVCNRSSGATNQNTDSIRKSNLAMEKQLASKCVITDKNSKNINNNSSSCSLDSVFSKATQSMLRGKGSQSGSQLSAKGKALSFQPMDKETKGQQQ
jgi:hypothetical protein